MLELTKGDIRYGTKGPTLIIKSFAYNKIAKRLFPDILNKYMMRPTGIFF